MAHGGASGVPGEESGVVRAKLDTSLRQGAFLALTWYPYLVSRSVSVSVSAVAVVPISEAQTMRVSSPSLGLRNRTW